MTPQVPVEPGQEVVLGVGGTGREQWSRTVVAHIDTPMIWLDAAPVGQPAIEVDPGTEVICHTWRHMDALYQMRARVAMLSLGMSPLVGLNILESRRVQQREYVRAPLATEARGFYPPPVLTGAGTTSFRLQVQDLSAGGLRGRTERLFEPGDELSIDLPLPDAPPPQTSLPLLLRGRVVALHDLPEPLNLRARVVRRVDADF